MPGDPIKGGSQSEGHAVQSIEIGFKDKDIPPWQNQLTIRAVVVSIGLGFLFTLLSMKQLLSTGKPSYTSMYAAIVGYSCIKTWIMIVGRSGILGKPFTRQENAMIQAFVLGITGVSYYGGFSSFIYAMSHRQAEMVSIGNDPKNIKEPHVAWIIAYLFLTSFSGVFFIAVLRKYMIIDLKLLFPNGHAIGHLLNSIHAPLTTQFARQQMTTFGKFFTISFFWSFIMWLFSGGEECGFDTLPIFGFVARDWSFCLNTFGRYVGVGMVCPTNTTMTVLFGSIVAWAFFFPYLRGKGGVWFDLNLAPDDYHGFGGYPAPIAVAMMLGDTTYHLSKIVIVALFHTFSNKDMTASTDLPVTEPPCSPQSLASRTDSQMRTQKFLNELIPAKVALAGYVALVAISTIVLPLIFPPVKWYHVVVMYVIATLMAFSRTHATGLTNENPSPLIGRSLLFIFGAWAGVSNGGVLVALVACGVSFSFISHSADLMTDFKTSYLTMASPRSIFMCKVIGIALGCIMSPLTFRYFQTHHRDFGSVGSPFSVPVASYYRRTAVLGLEGFDGLPKHCLHFAYAGFIIAIVINVIRDVLPKKAARFVPAPMALAMPIYQGPYHFIGFGLGALIVSLWRWKNKSEAVTLSPIVGSALICGDGFWILQESILVLIKWKPPLCVRFVPGE